MTGCAEKITKRTRSNPAFKMEWQWLRSNPNYGRSKGPCIMCGIIYHVKSVRTSEDIHQTWRVFFSKWHNWHWTNWEHRMMVTWGNWMEHCYFLALICKVSLWQLGVQCSIWFALLTMLPFSGCNGWCASSCCWCKAIGDRPHKNWCSSSQSALTKRRTGDDFWHCC